MNTTGQSRGCISVAVNGERLSDEVIRLPEVQQPFLDPITGDITAEWYRALQALVQQHNEMKTLVNAIFDEVNLQHP